jgi:heat shock protein HslJ
MKKILLGLILSLFCFNGVAQDPDPELFGTWYLYYYEESDLGSNWDISEMDPPITPYINISKNLSFNGEGAGNTYNGTYEFSETNVLTATSFNQTTNDCEPHNPFENSFFSTMHYYWYNINQDNDGLFCIYSLALQKSRKFP